MRLVEQADGGDPRVVEHVCHSSILPVIDTGNIVRDIVAQAVVRLLNEIFLEASA